jgi:hypothetical protein
MIVVPLPKTGNSSKFLVTVKGRGEFTIALSFTLRSKVWQLQGAEEELAAAQQLAEAIVSRHDPKLPFKDKYIFAEHNTDPALAVALKYLRKYQV